MVEKGVFLTDLRIADPDPGVVFNRIIIAGVAFFQDFVYGSATGAAKWLFIENDRTFPAVFPAVVAAYFTGRFQGLS